MPAIELDNENIGGHLTPLQYIMQFSATVSESRWHQHACARGEPCRRFVVSKYVIILWLCYAVVVNVCCRVNVGFQVLKPAKRHGRLRRTCTPLNKFICVCR